MPRSGVIRFDRSTSRSYSWLPSALLGLRVTVGSDISSATNGSSVRIVAGKKRSPAKPCASAAELVNNRSTAAAAAALHGVVVMLGLPTGKCHRPGRIGRPGATEE